MADRYVVDDRVGCIAVRDSTKIDPDEPGLHGDEEDVVKFWGKRRTRVQCGCCQQWRDEYVDDDHVEEAMKLARAMNAAESKQPT